MKTLIFIWANLLAITIEASPYRVALGAIFEGYDTQEEVAFRVAIDIVNQKHRLPYKLVPLVKYVEPVEVYDAKRGLTLEVNWDDPFGALDIACSLLQQGAVMIFDSLSQHNSNAVKSVCDAKGIPIIQTTFKNEHVHDCCSINLYPHPKIFAKVVVDTIKALDWKNFAILYENQESLLSLMDLLEVYNKTGHSISIKQLTAIDSNNFRPVLKEIWKSSQINFILECSKESLNDILEQAQQVGLMTHKYNYIIMDMDMDTNNLEPYQYGETNITGFRFIDPNEPSVELILEKMIAKQIEMGLQPESFNSLKIKTRTALTVDAVMLATKVLKIMGNFSVPSVLCNSTNSMEHGETAYNYLKTESYRGLSGKINFDHHGVRNNFGLEILELQSKGVVKIGTWNTNKGLNITRVEEIVETYDEDSLVNRTFKVMICLTEPYGIRKESLVKLTGNDQFEGFGVELFHELSLLEGFKYTFLLREDKKNGDYNETTKKWSGMIGDVIEGIADMAITDLTVTRVRQSGVDFTTSFMDLGIQILYAAPTAAPPGFFTFASPFHTEVWLLLTASFFGVSFAMLIMSRLSPTEWSNPYPCIEEPEYLVNQFGVKNSLWFSLGGLMQQGADIAPTGLSTRILAGIWWFFTLIMVSSYTANLAAFLTSEVKELPFSNVKELVDRADQLGIAYGAKLSGATHTFFKKSNNNLYKKIGKYMDEHKEYMPTDNNDGAKMAEKGNYAFFMESTTIRYVIKGSCNLVSVGNTLDEKSYAIAMKKNSPYRNRLSAAILKLKEKGIIAELERRWWIENRKKPECEEEGEDGAPPLNLKHVGGIFWCAIGGVFLALLIVFFEMTIYTALKYRRNCNICKEKLIEEFKFYFAFQGMVKPYKNIEADASPSGSQGNYEDVEQPSKLKSFAQNFFKKINFNQREVET